MKPYATYLRTAYPAKEESGVPICTPLLFDTLSSYWVSGSSYPHPNRWTNRPSDRLSDQDSIFLAFSLVSCSPDAYELRRSARADTRAGRHLFCGGEGEAEGKEVCGNMVPEWINFRHMRAFQNDSREFAESMDWDICQNKGENKKKFSIDRHCGDEYNGGEPPLAREFGYA